MSEESEILNLNEVLKKEGKKNKKKLEPIKKMEQEIEVEKWKLKEYKYNFQEPELAYVVKQPEINVNKLRMDRSNYELNEEPILNVVHEQELAKIEPEEPSKPKQMPEEHIKKMIIDRVKLLDISDIGKGKNSNAPTRLPSSKSVNKEITIR